MFVNVILFGFNSFPDHGGNLETRKSGFMCLEEIDGEFYSHFNGDSVEAPDDAAEDVDHVSHAEKSVVASSKKLKASRKRKRDDPRKKDGGEVVSPKKLQDGNRKKKRDTEDAQEHEAEKIPIEVLPGKEHGKNKKKKKERNSQSHDDGAVSIEKIVGNEAGKGALLFIYMHFIGPMVSTLMS